MNWSTLRLLYIHEMRMLLRSRRTVITSIVIPAVIMPLMIMASQYAQKQGQDRMNETRFRYAIAGPWAERVRMLIESNRHSDEFNQFQIDEIRIPDPAIELAVGTLHFYLETTAGEDADGKAASTSTSAPTASAAEPATSIPAVRIVYRGNLEIPRRGALRMLELMRFAQRNEAYSRLLASGFPSHPEGILAMTAQNVATESQVSGSNVGRFFTVILLMWMTAAGSIAAMDIIAGEKERGTLETLITSAAGRAEIVTAKQLTICSVALAVTLIQTVNALIYVKFRFITLPEGFNLSVSTATVLQLFALYIPMAAAIAAGLLIISAHARTYKEAQLHFLPFYLGSLVPALAAVLPGLKSRSIIALVPIANVSVAAREVLMGRPDTLMILVTVAVMTLMAAGLIRYSAQLLGREDIVVSAQHDQAVVVGGDDLFRRRVLQWFAVMWAVMFLAAGNTTDLPGIRWQLLFNEIGIFGLCSMLMVRRYRLKIGKILGLHRLRWPVWIAVLMAVPAAQIVARAFFKLVNTVIPTPDILLRQLDKQVTSTTLPAWEMYALIAVLPAICEEFAFRGILLHGLRHRFHPVVRCLFVGIVFGLFHYTLFRIAPTALLGVILTAIALMTGSILPGMLFHAANNAFAIWADSVQLDFIRIEWATYLAAFVVFALAMHIVYRNGIVSSSRL